jgi:GTP-binding protein
MLVDLPGYGFAKVQTEERFDFNEAVANYIEKRDNLAGVFVLIDATLPPQRIDLEFLRWLGSTGRPFVILRSKADRQSPTATREKIAEFDAALREVFGDVPTSLVCSSKTKAGRTELLAIIEKAMPSKKGSGKVPQL